jgi:hypothetical protein
MSVDARQRAEGIRHVDRQTRPCGADIGPCYSFATAVVVERADYHGQIHGNLADVTACQPSNSRALQAHWTGSGRRLAVQLPSLRVRDVMVSIRLASVLDHPMVDALRLTLDGMLPEKPIAVGQHGVLSMLEASFRLPEQHGQPCELAIDGLPFQPLAVPGPSIGDQGRKGLDSADITDIVLSVPPADGPANLGAVWPLMTAPTTLLGCWRDGSGSDCLATPRYIWRSGCASVSRSLQSIRSRLSLSANTSIITKPRRE